ncbi:MAG: RtcB family protein, partial [Phototrophicaceae bacterium]
GALGVGASVNIFVGMVEAPVFVRPYLSQMSRSELFALMTTGVATVAGTMLVLYAGILDSVIHNALGNILTASIVSAPAAILVSRLMEPETGEATAGEVTPPHKAQGLMDAVTRGALQGVELYIPIIALLVVLVALVSLVNQGLGFVPEILGEPLTLQRMLGWAMAPVVWLMGVPWEQAQPAGMLMGVKVVLNEFIAYLNMAQLPPEILDPRTRLIMTYAMCGFANFGSLGILIGGMGAMAPDRRDEIVALGLRSIIGGVLATDASVIPYAVGVDIACRMRMTVFNASPHVLDQKRERFRVVLEEQTCFGAGNTWDTPRDHDVMADRAWDQHPVARRFKDVAWRQLGTSGSGNHFVEFGALNVHSQIDSPQGTVPPGTYLAVLSHSGSRRFGLEMAEHYTRTAMDLRATLPKDFKHLAWLYLEESAGAEYWQAMELAGRYASANHAVIHRQIVDALRIPVLGGIENHHNFAWKEQVDGQDVIVHRKGATPAGAGVLGVIPGSMSAPGFVVRGLGNAESINSAAHGAGRRMSRKQAFQSFTWESVQHKLKAQGVELLSAGLDEAPGAYKDIRQVMQDQHDLVVALAEFQPKLVKMDPGRGARRDRKRQSKPKDRKGRDPRRRR